MIRLHSLSIREFRGIRALDLDLSGKNFVIQGPNGSGKSGVVDAIEFALTGSISRLMGPGTAGLTASRHGPHVDCRTSDSKVVLTVLLTDPQVTATIERTVAHPRTPQITPDLPNVLAVFANLEQHPEFVLSRREIIKYILTEASKRAAQIQSLLKLERVDRFRAVLKTASNNLTRDLQTAETSLATAQTAFKTVLSLKELPNTAVLAETNRLRALAGVQALQEITPDVPLDTGVLATGSKQAQSVSRKAIQADLKTLRNLFAEEHSQPVDASLLEWSHKLDSLRKDPALVADLEKEQLLELGLKYFDGQKCPLCDTPWADEALREHVKRKLAHLAAGKETKARLLALGTDLLLRCQTVERPLKSLEAAANALKAEGSESLASALTSLAAAQKKLTAVPDMLTLGLEDLTPATAIAPAQEAALLKLEEAAAKLPEETEQQGAKSLLIQAQARFEDARKAKQAQEQAKKRAERGVLALRLYDETSERVLNTLYQHVEANFADYYRLLHRGDESTFRAELRREAASVELGVDFYGRGLFPPGAYHSEGHQDGMGLCLYLALMKQVLGEDFTFAVLDDVVMSVDSSHRREVCQLLRERFPNTQFVLTTHDKVWLGQLHSSGLVTKKASLLFTRWTVDHGPFVSGAKEVWDEIRANLDADQVPTAAALLRRYLEEVSFDLADRLRADVPLRIDCAYELEDLLPRAVARWSGILKKAISAAQSWGHTELKTTLQARKDALKNAINASNVERWAINPAVHYNQWANFSRDDFSPVIDAFKTLLACFRCPTCDLWLYLSPPTPGAPTARCPCGKAVLNLALKPKVPPLQSEDQPQPQSFPPGSPSA